MTNEPKMAQVDFYNIPTTDTKTCLIFACKIINKAWQHNYTCYVHCNDSQQCEQLNQLLWSFKTDSFIPHGLLEEQLFDTPVILGAKGMDYQTIPHTLLVNLTPEQPQNQQQFARIVEFVMEDAHLKDNARQKFRLYQQANNQVKYHAIPSL